MDRLNELKGNTNYTSLEEGNIQNMSNDEIRRKIFLDKIENIMLDIEELTKINRKIDDCNQKNNYNIGEYVVATKNLFKKIIKEIRSIEDKNDGSNLQLNNINVCKRKITSISKTNNELISRNRADQKRNYKMVSPDISDIQVDLMISRGVTTKELLEDRILNEGVNSKFNEVKSKYNDVLDLETNIAELHQIFLDLAVLTKLQGEHLDSIESNVNNASDYISTGNVELVGAIEYQKSIRYKQCCIALIVLVIIGIVVGVIAAKLSR